MDKNVSRQQADVLYQASRALLAAVTVENVLQFLVQTTASLAAPGTGLGADHCLVLEFGPIAGQEPLVVADWDVSGSSSISRGSRIPAVCLTSFPDQGPLQTVAVPDVAEDGRLSPQFVSLMDLVGIRSFVSVPMGTTGSPYGLLLAGRRDLAACDETLIWQYEALAAQAAVVIVNLRLAQRAHRRAAQLETGAEISGAAISVLSMQDLLPLAAELIRERFGLYYVGIFLPDQDAGHVVLRAGTGPAGRRMLAEGYRLAVSETSMIGWCVTTGRARIALDVGADAVRFDNPLLPDTRSEMALPLNSRGRVLGAMTIQSAESAAFDREDVAVLQIMADQLGSAIENAQLFQESERRITELAIVNEIGQVLGSTQGLAPLFEVVHQQVSRLFDARNFYIATHQEGSDTWTSAFHVEQGERQTVARYSIARGLTGYIIRNRVPLLLRTAAAIRAFHQEQGLSTIGQVACCWLGVPLLVADKLVGVMGIQDYAAEYAFDDGDLALFATIGVQVAAALDNVRLLDETRRRLDNLTMLANVSQALASAELRADEIAGVIVRQFVEVLNVPEVSLSLLDPETGVMHTLGVQRAASAGAPLLASPQSFRLADYPATMRVMETLQPLVVQASDPDAPAAELAYMQEYGRATLVTLPLAAKGQAIGVAVLEEWSQERAYSPEELSLALTLANQAAVALENARLMAEAQSRAHQLSVANEVGQAIVSVLDLDAVLYQIVDTIKERFGHFFVGILLLEGSELVFRSGSLVGKSRVRWERGGLRLALNDYGLTVAAVTSGESILVNDVALDSRYGVVESLEPVRAELDTPIKAQGRTIGVLTVQSDRRHAFGQTDVTLLQLLANQAGSAIENARLFAETEDALSETETLYNVSRLLSAAGDLQEVVAALAEGMYLPSINRAILWNVDRDARDRPRALVSVATWHSGEGTPPLPIGVRFSLASFPAVRLTLATAPLFVEDVRTDERLDNATQVMFERQNALALAILPLWVGRRQTGVLMFVAEEPHRFTAKEIRPYRSLAGQLAIAVENRRLFEQTQRQLAEQEAAARDKSELAEQLRARAAELALLNEMGAALTAALGVESVVETVYRYTSHLMDTTSFYVARYNPGADEISFPIMIENNKRVQLPPRRGGNGLTEHVVRTGQPLLIEDKVAEKIQELGAIASGARSLSWLGVPLKVGEEVLGVLGIESHTTPNHYGPRDLDLLTAIANQAAIALQNARLFEETELALAETETLYRISAGLNAARTYDEVLFVLRQHTLLGEADLSVSLSLFDRPCPEGERPVWVEPIARWGAGGAALTRYPLAGYGAEHLLQPDTPTVASNIATDPRLDEATRTLYLQGFGAQSTIIVPLVAGGQWFGYVDGLYRQPVEFSEAHVQHLRVLVTQAAVVVQNLRQLYETQARAQREQTLREIVTRVRSSTDPEVVVRTAVRELGQALGRPAFVRLAGPEELSRAPGSPPAAGRQEGGA